MANGFAHLWRAAWRARKATSQWLPEGAFLNNPACNVGWRRDIVCDGVSEARALFAHLTTSGKSYGIMSSGKPEVCQG